MFLVVVLCYWYAKYAVNFISYGSNLITLVWRVTSVLFAGRRRCWPSRKAKSNHRFPDPYHTCVAGTWREGWAGYRGVPPSHPHPRGLCHPTQESQLWILNHHHYHPANKKKAHAHWHFSLRGESTLRGSWQWLYLATKKSRTGLFFPVSSQFVAVWPSSCSH